MPPDMKDEQWQTIAEQASKEMDGKKLSVLVEQLCTAMDERNKKPSGSVEKSEGDDLCRAGPESQPSDG